MIRRPGPQPSVSVVVPVLDDAQMLRHCLDRLAAQNYPPHEVIVVDNGSTDATAEVARCAGARVVVEPLRGIGAAAAAGYDAARGEVIARCDADSRPEADWTARIAARFAADTDLDGLTGSGCFYDRPLAGRVLCRAYLAGYYWFCGAAAAGVPLWGSNCAFRRSAWLAVRDRVHRTRPDLHDDLDLSLQLLPANRTAYDPELHIGACGRMFHSPAQFIRRFRWAWNTLALGWETGSPGRRWLQRVRSRRVGVEWTARVPRP